MPDGTTAYTRDGSFQVDANGQLVTASGFLVQPAITIPPNVTSITIGRDGTVSVTQAGQQRHRQVGQLQLATFINPAGLQSSGREPVRRDRRLRQRQPADTPATNGAGLLSQGYVETSNVNVVEELVNMIQTQRAYEINCKADPDLRPDAAAAGAAVKPCALASRCWPLLRHRVCALLLLVTLTGCALIAARAARAPADDGARRQPRRLRMRRRNGAIFRRRPRPAAGRCSRTAARATSATC